VQALHGHLIEHGVDVIAENGLTAYKEAKEASQPGAAKKPELDLTVEPSLDSLRLYLRSIGRVDLLTAEQERSGSSEATWSPSGTWSRRTCASWSRSPRAIWGEGSASWI
jgi:hypothetical protein